MSDRVVEIWFCRLKPGQTTASPEFTDIWTKTLALGAAYSGPPTRPGVKQHILYQSETDPTLLAMVTGYPSLEVKKGADEEFMEKHLQAMYAVVDHYRQLIVHVDISDLPLASGKVSIVTAKSELGSQIPGQGNWDVSVLPGQAETWGKVWVQILDTEDVQKLNGGDIKDVYTMTKIMSE
ncbi:hypothetical protein BX600DRAFT_476958 [Xylariales sp. PMI_506]|nr:hypothetical protein BX600DRAFT_476958 [Xylariales sp. PMI_506]